MSTKSHASPGADLLVARDLEFSYEPPRGDEVGFQLHLDFLDIHPGEIHALIGPNGCGKSTTLRLMSGIVQPSSGRVEIEGRPLPSLRRAELARRVAFLPQEALPLFSMRTHEVVLMGRHPWTRGFGLARQDDLHLTGLAMQRMNVAHLHDRLFQTLSGGERQRVLLASILAQEPRVMLLDEPTAALDIHHQADVFHLLRAEAARGVGILVVTHDLTLAGHFANRITLMKSGAKVHTGGAREVLEENRLREVYGERVRVIADPASGLPCVLPSVEVASVAAPQQPESPTPTAPFPPVGQAPRLPSSRRTESPPLSATHSVTTNFARALTRRAYLVKLAAFALLAIVACGLAPWFGAETISPSRAIGEMLSEPREAWGVPAQILALRLPRVAMGMLAGMALGCVGAAFQSLLRNPLAEPYTLGIASAGSLGAVIALSFPCLLFMLGPISSVQVWAFVFALLSVLFLWQVSRKAGAGLGVTGLLLTGIAMGLVSAAMIMLVRFLASPLTARAMDLWFVGGVEVTGWSEVLPTIPFTVLGLFLMLASARDLNQIEFGEEMALGRGVELHRVQRRVLLGGSLATAAVVSVAGPIGFVGLLVPHIVRRAIGSDQRLVLPASMLGGGALLVLTDAIARSISIAGRGAELPVGILTSLVGGPLFLALLVRRRW